MLHHGLYEQVINNALNSELAEIPEARKAVAPIDKAEASKVLAQYRNRPIIARPDRPSYHPGRPC